MVSRAHTSHWLICASVCLLMLIANSAQSNEEPLIYDLHSQEENSENERSTDSVDTHDTRKPSEFPDPTSLNNPGAPANSDTKTDAGIGDIDAAKTRINTRIIEPNIPSRVGKRPLIDDEYYEVSLFTGSYKVDGFPPGFSIALRATYLLESSSFLELEHLVTEIDQRTLLSVGRSPVSKNDRVSATSLNYGFSLYNANLFFGNNRSLSSNLHVIAGFGRFSLGENSQAMINLGAGIRTLLNDSITLRLEVRSTFVDKNFLEPSDSFSHNIQINAGFGILF